MLIGAAAVVTVAAAEQRAGDGAWRRHRAGTGGPALALAGAVAVGRLGLVVEQDLPRREGQASSSTAAAGVAVAVRAARRTTVRQLLICVLVVCAISVVLDLLNVSARGAPGPSSAGSGVLTGAYWFLLYLPAVFVVEEVFFRGVLDSYVRPTGTGTGWLSATYVSALWGLWHLPIVLTAGATTPVLAVVVGLLVVQITLGIPLSLGWRRSGSLLVPGTAHALSDAIRNVLDR